MTAQFSDRFCYHDHEYDLAGISEGELFDRSLFDLRPIWRCTACCRGYQAVFGLSRIRLVLDTLRVHLEKPDGTHERQEGRPINGVKAIEPHNENDCFNNHYEGLDYHLKHTGGLLLADEFIIDLSFPLGFQPAWTYKRVLELTFDNGVLKEKFDRSEHMAEFRQRFVEQPDENELDPMPIEDEIARFVERAFGRKYRRM